MKKLLTYRLLPLVLAFTLGIVSCKKDDDDNNNTPTPTPTPQDEIVVSGISPANGPYSTIVTIGGSGFNTTVSNNVVKFNGKTATVLSATATQIVAIVPEAAGTGNVTVAWGSKNGTGPVFNFIYTITVSTFCGNGAAGFLNGSAATSQFNAPIDVDFDSQGNLYVSDHLNNRIRMITSAGVSSTFAGSGTPGSADGNSSTAQFNHPVGIDFDANGNLFVADQGNERLRKITPSGVVTTIAGSTTGYADGNGSSAQFTFITGVAVAANGNIYIGDQGNHRIRVVSPSAVVSTLAGNSNTGLVDGTGTAASFYYPAGVAFDNSGNILVCDYYNHSIRKVTTAGVVTTYAGTGMSGAGDGPLASATFSGPFGIAVASNGTIYVLDRDNGTIRQISTVGEVTTIAGSTNGFADGAGSTAKFDNPCGIAIDANGALFVADVNNNRIRKITIQ
jgi:sugar lactone lactonase YvrE